MKKIFILTSALLLLVLLLTGCGQKVEGKKYELNTFDSEIQNDKGFVLKEKMFSYGDENILLIHAENKLSEAKT